ncbi:MAG: D-Ala-D-Ala carboxypeptidase family metallohydrolase [Myxococcota bacterium]|jgi:hypothetical protein
MKLDSGTMTSGRRTRQGNEMVGGVPGSWHVDGNAVDYDGPDLSALLSEVRGKFPSAKAFIHRNHVHAQDRNFRVPYFGRRGTVGAR